MSDVSARNEAEHDYILATTPLQPLHMYSITILASAGPPPHYEHPAVHSMLLQSSQGTIKIAPEEEVLEHTTTFCRVNRGLGRHSRCVNPPAFRPLGRWMMGSTVAANARLHTCLARDQ